MCINVVLLWVCRTRNVGRSVCVATLALLNFLHTTCTCYCNANMLSGQEHFILLLRKGCWVGRAVVDFLGGNKGKSDIRASPHRRRSFGSKEKDQAHERHNWATRALTRTRELGRNTRRLGNFLPRVVSVSIAARFESNSDCSKIRKQSSTTAEIPLS